MDMTMLGAVALSAVAAGGVAYALIYPILSGESRAAKRQKAFVDTSRSVRAERSDGTSRRDQVAQSLKDIEQREKNRNKVTLEGRIAQAGLAWSTTKFYVISACIGLVLGLATFTISGEPIVGAVGFFAGGFGFPRWLLGYLKTRRVKKYLEELPNAMDVIVRGIKSGLPLNDCLRMIASEAAEPVRSEFRTIIEQQQLGISTADAVAKLYERVPVPESNFFAIVIAIQSKAGGNLSETLGNLSRVLRERKKMKAKVQAISQEAKASAGIIGSLPVIVALLTYLSSPRYIELLWTTDGGRIALVIGGFWMAIGIFVMRKMINFEV